MKGQRTAYFDLAGLWLALNLAEDSSACPETYTEDMGFFQERLRPFLVDGRVRNQAEGQSLYFKDPDGHLLELHTSCLQTRIEYYQRTRTDMEFLVGGNSNE
jgi:metallothiol transferase